MQRVEITLVENPHALWPRRGEWNALVERNATDTVFQTLEWQCSWWRAFGGDVQSLVLLAETAGQMVGVAPLMVSVQRIFGRPRRVVEFVGGQAADYCDFIVDRARPAAVAALLLAWLVDHAGRWDLLRLVNIAEASPLLELLPEVFGRRGYATELQPFYECPTRIFGDRAADQRLVRKRNIRWNQNRLRRHGRVEFKRLAAAEEIERHLDAFFRQHAERWAATRTPSAFRDERERSFYRELVRLLAPNGWILFSFLSLNEVPIAFNFGFERRGRLYLIRSTFDPGYGEYGPGMLQINNLLEDAMRRDARELDFTIGEEAYKYRFANHTRLSYAARVHRRWMFYGIDRILSRARALAGRSPVLERLGRRFVKPLLGGTP